MRRAESERTAKEMTRMRAMRKEDKTSDESRVNEGMREKKRWRRRVAGDGEMSL